ncbi:MAG: malate dehydrogenase [Bacillati bacterium ANGP1]|uniref:Malate dehydrogenase n=1 Tax=Candidatus Segetimicrobium genomatis TaxID=2569760 RepID=A0A537LHH9_9BACT|nr:MAG: malate dehydrogenase [Terrabacteria group bacterium ANGP1]
MAKTRAKVTIVGAGNVGHSAAQWMLSHRLADIVLVDVIEGMPQGKALDLTQAEPIEGVDLRITGTNGYDETAGSDVVVVVAGIARKPGMSREELLATNAGIVRGVIEQVTRRSPNGHLIVVTNPLDAMVYLAYKVSGFPPERVMGQSGALDSTRFRTFIAHALGVSVQDVSAIVIGAHSDTHMVPVASLATVGGIPLSRLLPADRIAALAERTRRGGAEIVGLLKTGSAFFAPGAAIAQMVEAILLDRKRVLPLSAYLTGQYGVRDLYVGVPAVLGAGGVERILDAPMDPSERAAFDAAVASIRETVALLKL